MKNLIRFAAISTASILLLLSTGCDLFTANSVSTSDSFKKVESKAGVYAEQYIPSGMLAVAAFDYQEKEQQDAFNTLRANFATEKEWEDLWEWLEEEAGPSGSDLTFDDLEALWGDSPRAVVAVDQDLLEYAFGPKYTYPELSKTKSPTEWPEDTGLTPTEEYTNEAESALDGSASSEEEAVTEVVKPSTGLIAPSDELDLYDFDEDFYYPEPVPFKGNYYVVVKIGDVEKYNKVKAAAEEDLLEEGEEPSDVWGEDNIFITRHQDMMLMSNSEKNLENAIDRAKKAKDSIKDDEVFSKIWSKLPYPHVAYFYIDTEAYLDATFKAVEADEPEMAKLVKGIYGGFMNFGEATATAIVLEDNAIRSYSYSYIDESTLKEGDEGFEAVLSAEMTLLDKVPGEGMLFYEEFDASIFNLIFTEMMNAMSAQGIASSEELASEFKAVTGLDLNKDVLSWMDKSMALYMSDSGGLVPNFGFWFDASSDAKAAQRVMDVLDSTITVGLMGLKANLPPDQAEIVAKGTVKIRGKEVNRISVDFSQFSEQDRALLDIDDAFAEEKVEFYYGVTGDDVVVFALHNGLDKLYGGKNALSKSEDFKDAMKLMGEDYNEGVVVYVDPNVVFDYLDRLNDMADEAAGYSLFSGEEGEIYEMVKKYMNPIKFMVAGAKVSKTESESVSVIKIGE